METSLLNAERLKKKCVKNTQVFIQLEKNTLVFSSTNRENMLMFFYLCPAITNSGLN